MLQGKNRIHGKKWRGGGQMSANQPARQRFSSTENIALKPSASPPFGRPGLAESRHA
jgi:hypothetical protein